MFTDDEPFSMQEINLLPKRNWPPSYFFLLNVTNWGRFMFLLIHSFICRQLLWERISQPPRLSPFLSCTLSNSPLGFAVSNF